MTTRSIAAVGKVGPYRAGKLADLLGQMRKEPRRIEIEPREAAIQGSFLAA